MRRTPLLITAATLAVTLGATACGDPNTTPDAGGTPTGTDGGSPILGTTDPVPPTTTTADPGGGGGGGAGGWPSSEDCFTYDAQMLGKRYEAGVHVIFVDHGPDIIRVYGGPGDMVSDQALALARRSDTVCYIGRGNSRPNPDEYIFEYWRDPSPFALTPIPDSDDDCSPYDPTNLQVDDTGSGWRVKDDDHVLQLFDTEADANNGGLVLAHYDQICYIANENFDGPADITYA